MPSLLYVVDAFTDRAFAGNPAAVCLLRGWPDDARMQAVASEMNLSETAFLWRQADGVFPLRWMTPTVEVDLCGHATLASAHVLFETGIAKPGDVIRFNTRSGELTAARSGDEIELDFPARPADRAEPPPGLVEALGVAPRFVGWTGSDYVVEVASEADVRAAAPDFRRLAAVGCRGVILTAAADGGRFDFVSRFFAPAAGIDEDPVTGSAHCCLAVYWGERLGRQEMVGFQASARGGVVRVTLAGDRIKLGGRAVTVVEGTLRAEW